jgi:hypothetical protein
LLKPPSQPPSILEGGVKKPLSKMERGWGEVKKIKAKILYTKTV